MFIRDCDCLMMYTSIFVFHSLFSPFTYIVSVVYFFFTVTETLTVELAPYDIVPYSVYNFLEITRKFRVSFSFFFRITNVLLTDLIFFVIHCIQIYSMM